MESSAVISSAWALLKAMSGQRDHLPGSIPEKTGREFNAIVRTLPGVGIGDERFLIPEHDFVNITNVTRESVSGQPLETHTEPKTVARTDYLVKLDAILLLFSIHPLTGTSMIGFTTP